ncbi:MAG: cyclic-di-AMP receptor [bacterium]
MIFAIIHDHDVHSLTEKLNREEIKVTRIASTGGFLKSGNTTMLIGVEEEKVEKVLEIIKKICKTQTCKTIPAFFLDGYGIPPINRIHEDMAYETSIGGATVFIINVENFFQY